MVDVLEGMRYVQERFQVSVELTIQAHEPIKEHGVLCALSAVGLRDSGLDGIGCSTGGTIKYQLLPYLPSTLLGYLYTMEEALTLHQVNET